MTHLDYGGVPRQKLWINVSKKQTPVEPNIEENYYLQNNVIPELILHSLDQEQPPLLLFFFFLEVFPGGSPTQKELPIPVTVGPRVLFWYTTHTQLPRGTGGGGGERRGENCSGPANTAVSHLRLLWQRRRKSFAKGGKGAEFFFFNHTHTQQQQK